MTRLLQSAALAAADSAVLAAPAERLADNAMSLTLGKCSSSSRNISRTSSALSAEPGESLVSFSCLITNSVTQAPSRKLIKTEVTSCTCWTAVLKKIPTQEACLRFFTVALWNRADHYIFALWFLLPFFLA